MSDTGTDRKKTPWLELAIAALGALMVVSMAGYLFYDAFGTGKATPTDIVLERGTAVERGAGWYVPVLVRNLGDEPAEAVELRAELERDDGEIETTTLTLDFLPPRGRARAVFVFEQDPAGGELRLQTVGYLRP